VPGVPLPRWFLFAASFRVCPGRFRRRALTIRDKTLFVRVAENTPIEPDQDNTCEGSARRTIHAIYLIFCRFPAEGRPQLYDFPAVCCGIVRCRAPDRFGITMQPAGNKEIPVNVHPAFLVAFIFLLSFKVCRHCLSLFHKDIPCTCFVGVRVQPSEPHLTSYLRHVKGFTDDQVNNDIYPVWTYAYFALMVVATAVLLLPGIRGVMFGGTRLGWYILLGACGRVATRFLLLFGASLPAMQLMQVTYAMGSVSEILFAAYALEVTPDSAAFVRVTALTQVGVFPSHTPRVLPLFRCGYVHVYQHAYLLAHVVSGVVGDLVLHWHPKDLTVLMWISAVWCVTASMFREHFMKNGWFVRPQCVYCMCRRPVHVSADVESGQSRSVSCAHRVSAVRVVALV
jgi:hypothetical protein